MSVPLTTGERIGDMRTDERLSQKELSKLIGITTSQMSRIENDKAKYIGSDVLIKLAKKFNVSIDFILGLTDISSPKNYDIGELGLSEAAVKVFLSSSVDMQILNKVFEHKLFPYLMNLMKRYADGSIAAGVADQNEIYDFMTSAIGDFVNDNPEHKAEAKDDIRYIKSHKMSDNEAVLVKIQRTFMAIIRDIKSEADVEKAPSPVATSEFMKGAWEQLKDKPRSEITEADVSEAVTNMIKQKTNIDGTGSTLFQKLLTRILKMSGKKP